jgi:hypothetical protein
VNAVAAAAQSSGRSGNTSPRNDPFAIVAPFAAPQSLSGNNIAAIGRAWGDTGRSDGDDDNPLAVVPVSLNKSAVKKFSEEMVNKR